MIGKIRGIVEEIAEEYLIINVNDVGYVVHVTSKTLHNSVENCNITLHIETHVREDHIQLFGFLSLVEKKCFLMLIAVSGVGPRVALSILGILSPDEIHAAVASQNVKAFTQVSGVGKKLAERILLELKDKVASNKVPLVINAISQQLEADAILALTTLGIKSNEAASLVNSVVAENKINDLNQLIKMALQQRGK